MRNIFLIALFSMVIAAEAKAGNSFSTSQQVSSQREGNSIKLASASDGLCNGKFLGKNGTIWARYYRTSDGYINDESPVRVKGKNTLSISLRVSPDVRSVLEDPPFAGKRQPVSFSLQKLSINSRDIDLNNVSAGGAPRFDGGVIISNHKFKGSSSLRSLKGGEKIKAVFSIHGTFGKERGLAVTRVFECTVPSSTADDPFYPSATTPL
jgi:hypothetical protein